MKLFVKGFVELHMNVYVKMKKTKNKKTLTHTKKHFLPVTIFLVDFHQSERSLIAAHPMESQEAHTVRVIPQKEALPNTLTKF